MKAGRAENGYIILRKFASGAERDGGEGEERGSDEVFNHLRVDGEINFRYVSSFRCVGLCSLVGAIFGAALGGSLESTRCRFLVSSGTFGAPSRD